MIILDTNVISEVMLPVPSPLVMDWLDARPTFDLATTAINIAEIRFGLARLPAGRRRIERERLFGQILERAFGNRILNFDRLAADVYGELVATRDAQGFAGCGFNVINPWDHGAP